MLFISSRESIEQPDSIGQMFLFAAVIAVVITQGLIKGGVGSFWVARMLGAEILKVPGCRRVLLEMVQAHQAQPKQSLARIAPFQVRGRLVRLGRRLKILKIKLCLTG